MVVVVASGDGGGDVMVQTWSPTRGVRRNVGTVVPHACMLTETLEAHSCKQRTRIPTTHDVSITSTRMREPKPPPWGTITQRDHTGVQ